jgi:hypothetical protein
VNLSWADYEFGDGFVVLDVLLGPESSPEDSVHESSILDEEELVGLVVVGDGVGAFVVYDFVEEERKVFAGLGELGAFDSEVRVGGVDGCSNRVIEVLCVSDETVNRD